MREAIFEVFASSKTVAVFDETDADGPVIRKMASRSGSREEYAIDGASSDIGPEKIFTGIKDHDEIDLNLGAFSLYRSVRIDGYRADLLLEHNGSLLVIECDGHEWHERTQQQAAYDRARDRALLLRGIETMRFTGSEIFHSPHRCAADVLAFAERAYLVAQRDDWMRQADFCAGADSAIARAA